MRASVAVLVLLAGPLLAGCSSPASGPAPDALASFYPLEFLASRIGGSDLRVEALVPAGVEPHEYEPTTTDLVRVGEAKVLILQGAGFEAWAERARSQAGGARVVVATEGLDLRMGNPAEDAPDEQDPHTWLDPVLFANMSRVVERGLAEAFPDEAAAFRARGDALRADLAALDAEYRAGLATCETRFVITSHASFGYMAARYGFEQRGISGLSPEAEPDPQTIQRLVEEARAHNVTVVFFEDLVSPRVAQVVADEVGGTTRVLSPIEGIPEDDARAGADYFTLMRSNLDGLRAGMRCA